MKQTYNELKEAFEAYQQGTLTSDKLKPIAAPYGIYEQRNGLFMLRIRVTGGVIACEALKRIADLLEQEGGYAHLTSRQDIQIHDVPAEKAPRFIAFCDNLGLPFKGGGGNTYRNIVASAYSGVSADSLFDVYPYSLALNQALQASDKALQLPRKLKIGVFASDAERLTAAVQDIGFLAAQQGGKEGFTVYVGGGMGRDSTIGLKLFEFLLAEEIIRVAMAGMELFHDHGDRANRNQARIRFLLRRLGDEVFTKLFLEYYEQAKMRYPQLLRSQSPTQPTPSITTPLAPAHAALKGIETWQAIAVSPTRFGEDQVSVRLFVPYGDLCANELRQVADLALHCGLDALTLLPSQDLLMTSVHRSWLPAIYQVLSQQLAGIDLRLTSYKGHILACVGATVCKIGMVDSSAVADAIAKELDRYLPADTPEKVNLLRIVADEVRISGCPNACSGHPVARLGIGCVNQKIEGEIRPHAQLFCDAGVTNGQPRLAAASGGVDPIEAIVAQVIDQLTSWAHLTK